MQSSNHSQPRSLSDMRRIQARRRQNAARRRVALSVMFVVMTGVFSFGFIRFFEAGFLASVPELIAPDGPTGTQGDNNQGSTTVPQESVSQLAIPNTVEQTINLLPPQAQSAKMLSLPENGKVDMVYFNDAVFMGDSLAQGFVEAYNIFPNSFSAAYKGMSTQGFVTNTVEGPDGAAINPIDLMGTYSPAKIYILAGANDLVWASEAQVLASFTMLLDTLNTKLPNAIIYLMSIPPQTEARSADERYSVSYINSLNDKLAVIAADRGVQYLDLHEILADSSGYLRADIAQGDGYHIKPEGYIEIRDYLQTHTVHTDANPYLPGSPYYIDPSATAQAEPVAEPAPAETAVAEEPAAEAPAA